MGLARYPWLMGKLLALAFIFFGGGVLATSILPLAMMMPGRRRERTQAVIRAMFRFYLWLLQALGMIELVVDQPELFNACRGEIIIANHPSLLDVVVLMALIPRAQCIVKHELWSHRFLGALMRTAGYIRNDLEPLALMEQCKAALDDGRCLIIFPEGTRTKPGQQPRFQRGFANIATLVQAPVQSVVISCDPAILYKGEPWWHAPEKKPVFRFVWGERLDKNFYIRYDQRSIAARKLVDYFEACYRKIIPYAGP